VRLQCVVPTSEKCTVHCPHYILDLTGTVIFVNENENGEKRESNEFVNEN